MKTAKPETTHKPSGPIIKHRIKIFAESQGRKVACEIISKSNHDVESVIKPGASFKCGTTEAFREDLNEEDRIPRGYCNSYWCATGFMILVFI